MARYRLDGPALPNPDFALSIYDKETGKPDKIVRVGDEFSMTIEDADELVAAAGIRLTRLDEASTSKSDDPRPGTPRGGGPNS